MSFNFVGKHVIKLFLLALSIFSFAANAADIESDLMIRNHQFFPAELRVPANTRIKLTVHNQDSTSEEFESYMLNREKLVPAGDKTVIYIGPLKTGRYDFFGEFNQATAKGVVISE
jgi:hypothetical protein